MKVHKLTKYIVQNIVLVAFGYFDPEKLHSVPLTNSPYYLNVLMDKISAYICLEEIMFM